MLKTWRGIFYEKNDRNTGSECRKIFDLYLQGYGVHKIKCWLEEHQVQTVTGKDIWSTSTIDRMLSNEKYAGRLVL